MRGIFDVFVLFLPLYKWIHTVLILNEKKILEQRICFTKITRHYIRI